MATTRMKPKDWLHPNANRRVTTLFHLFPHGGLILPDDERELPLDLEILGGLHEGYLRSADAQWQRHTAAGEEPPITEDSLHNRFLRLKAFYPGLAKYVAGQLDKKQYRDRVKFIAESVAVSILRDEPTLRGVAEAVGKTRWNDTDARRVRRMVAEYLPDVISRSGAPKRGDRRERLISTAFDPSSGWNPPSTEAMGYDEHEWKIAPPEAFRGPQDQLVATGTLLPCLPEYLRFWVIVQSAINQALRAHPKARGTKAYETIRHPLAVNVLANHAIALCADSWWVKRSDAVRADLLSKPRPLDYTEEDAKAAVHAWGELARLHEEWSKLALTFGNLAATALARWGAISEAALFTEHLADLDGLPPAQRGNLLANAGIFYRNADNVHAFKRNLRRALPLVQGTDARLDLVTRINLAESLGGPRDVTEAAELLEGALEFANATGQEIVFWINVSAMFRRLGDPLREEAALDALLPVLSAETLPTLADVAARQLELSRVTENQRPMKPIESIACSVRDGA